MNYVKLTKFDTANGIGIREVLWVAGCEHHCKECHNPETWDKDSGKPFTEDTLQEILDDLNVPWRAGITFSGGDPLAPYNRGMIGAIAAFIRTKYGDTKSIWCYTGYRWEFIKRLEVIELFDVVVDGKFQLNKRDISLPYCGSSNQRVIDVQKSLETDEIVLWYNPSL